MKPPGVAEYPAGARLATRVIDDHELLWMLRGRARLITGDAELALQPGLLVLIPPGLRHGFGWDQRRPCRHGFLRFDPADAGIPLPTSIRTRRMTKPLAGLCAHLLRLDAEQTGPTLRLLLELFKYGPPTALADPLTALVTQLRREWANAPLRRLGVDELAARVGVSRGHLSRVFQAELGVGLAAGLERLRCYRAEILLTRTDMPVGVIAGQCGFADPYHFSHRFTRLYGVSPSAYRASGGPSALDEPGVRRLAAALWDS